MFYFYNRNRKKRIKLLTIARTKTILHAVIQLFASIFKTKLVNTVQIAWLFNEFIQFRSFVILKVFPISCLQTDKMTDAIYIILITKNQIKFKK